MTQYERDFERVSATVRKEVIRFEVQVCPFCIHLQLECFVAHKCLCLTTQKEKAKNFKSQIIKYLECLLQSQQQVSVSLKCEISYFHDQQCCLVKLVRTTSQLQKVTFGTGSAKNVLYLKG